jgi:probable HAF family extracellular repeat protein
LYTHTRNAVVAAVMITTIMGSAQLARSAEPSFRALGHLPGTTLALARDVSADGSVVIGWAGNDGQVGPPQFRWTSSGGMVPLPGFSNANAVSADGSVVVGNVYDPNDLSYHAVRWSAATGAVRLPGFPDLPDFVPFNDAKGVSADGSIVVGTATNGGENVIARWDGGRISSLGYLQPLPRRDGTPAATAVTGNGSVIAGYSPSHGDGYEAVRWTSAGGVVGLGDLPGGEFYSIAFAMSADGSVIVGDSKSAPGRSEAFRWTERDGIVGLGHLPIGNGGDLEESQAFDVSADGSVVVGRSTSGVNHQSAFVWTVGGGMRSLADELRLHGVDTTGWTITTAWGISADGSTVVGDAVSPTGVHEAYIAVLPEPGPVAVLALAGLASLARRPRTSLR